MNSIFICQKDSRVLLFYFPSSTPDSVCDAISIVSVVQVQSSNPRISIHKPFCQGEFAKPIILPLLISLHFASATESEVNLGFWRVRFYFNSSYGTSLRRY